MDNYTLTGNNNVVNAIDDAASGSSTWGALDSITGTGTGNTFNVATALEFDSVPAGATVSGIQTLNFIEASNNSVTLDSTTNFTGLTSLNVTSAGGDVSLIAAATNNVMVTELPGAAEAGVVTVDGGNNVTVSSNAEVDIGGTTAPAGIITVTEKGANFGDQINVDGGTSVNVTATGTEIGQITIGANTAPTGAITVTTTDSAVTAAAPTAADIDVKGGTTVSVTENIAAPTVTGTTGTLYTATGGNVAVTGTATTTSVTVAQSADVHAVAGIASTGGTDATDSVAFNALATAQTVVFNGLTVTAGASAVSAALVAALYAAEASGVAANVTAAENAIITASVGSTFTGAWAGGFTAGAPAAGTVLFTATTPGVGAALTANGSGGAAVTFTAGTAPITSATAAVGGVADGQVVITDVNAGTAKVGTITSVSLDNYSAGATIHDNALSSLTLAGTAGGVTLDDAGLLASKAVATLTLNVNALTANPGDTAAAAVADTTVTEGANAITTLNIVTGGASASTLNFVDSALTTVNVSGTQDITLTTSSASVTAINVSGGAGVTTEIGAATVFTSTGTGNDVVTLDGALTKTSGGSILFGSGDNSLLAAVGGSIAAGVTVNGGTSGMNTISASLVNAGNAADISHFQILDVSGYGSLAGSGAFDTSLMGSAVSGVAISTADTAGTATLQDLAAAVTVTDMHDADTSTLVLTHSAGAGMLAVNFADATALGHVQSLVITSTGDTALAVNAGGAAGNGAALSLTETDNHLTTLTVTGSNEFFLSGIATDSATTATVAVNVASSLTTIDASATTGGVSITAGASHLNVADGVTTVTYTGLTIHGGTGGDYIENDANSGVIIEGATAANTIGIHNELIVTGSNATITDTASATADIIQLNGVSDTASLGSGTGVTVSVMNHTANSIADTVTFGSGTATVSDALTYQTVASTTSSATNGNVLTLSGTLHGETLSFTIGATNAAGALGAATSVAAAQTFDQAVFAASHVTGGTNSLTWFQYAGNTYVEAAASAGSATGTAELVKIAGVVDLSHATVAAGHITFA